TIYCYLPVDVSGEATHRLRVLPQEVLAVPDDPACCRQQHIALADDEDSLRELLVEILSDRGYTVHAFANGRELVDNLHDGLRCQTVLLDMIMPIMNGADAADIIASLPDPPTVILMTGHAGDADITPLRERGLIAEVLYKPFRDEELLAAICRNCSLSGCDRSWPHAT
ncbi:MAG: response regulator, partial [Planctomycetota bacterium]